MMNPPSHLLELLGGASLRASLVVVLLLALRPWLRRLFGSGWVSLLWLVVLVRLLVPWSAESSWSPFRPEAKGEVTMNTTGLWKVNVTVREGAPDPVAIPTAVDSAGLPSPREAWLLWAWAAGSLATLSWFGVRSWRTRGVLLRAHLSNDARLLRVWAGIPPSLRVRAALCVTDEVPVAALVGVWRPRILLPREWLAVLSDEELRHVLLHELGHACRADLLVQWFFAFAQCLHWFNPFVWLAARGARIDAELACDAWVLARTAESGREAYGETLLRTSQLLRNHLSMSPAAIGMAASRDTLVARVHHVSAFRPVTKWKMAMGVTVAIGATALLMTSRTAAQATVEPPAPTPEKSTPAPEPPAAAAETAKPAPEAKAPPPAAEPLATPAPDGRTKAPDNQKRQIEIESKFFEVSESTAKKVGLVPMPMDPDLVSGGTKKKSKSAPPVLAVNSVLSEADVTALLRKLNGMKGTDLLSAPRVTTRIGQRAVIEIIREFRYPTEFDLDKASGMITPTAFETRNLGVTMEVDPIATTEDVIDLQVVPQIVELEGFMRAKDAQPVPLRSGRSVGANMNIKDFAGVTAPKDDVLQPIFSERKITTNVSIRSGTTILLGGLRRDTAQEGKPPLSSYLYILITARIIDHPAVPPPAVRSPKVASAISPEPPSATPFNKAEAEDDDVPVAKVVPGKPGYILSPFWPDAGYIDVRGFPSGTKIKCPYTGKIFKTP
jgi:beta-lactamase regulating signal transducer with metallopeptidase domain